MVLVSVQSFVPTSKTNSRHRNSLPLDFLKRENLHYIDQRPAILSSIRCGLQRFLPHRTNRRRPRCTQSCPQRCSKSKPVIRRSLQEAERRRNPRSSRRISLPVLQGSEPASTKRLDGVRLPADLPSDHPMWLSTDAVAPSVPSNDISSQPPDRQRQLLWPTCIPPHPSLTQASNSWPQPFSSPAEAGQSIPPCRLLTVRTSCMNTKWQDGSVQCSLFSTSLADRTASLYSRPATSERACKLQCIVLPQHYRHRPVTLAMFGFDGTLSEYTSRCVTRSRSPLLFAIVGPLS